jgi:hypothetical protein
MSHKFIEWIISVKVTVCVGSYCNILQIRPGQFFIEVKQIFNLNRKKSKIIDENVPDTW